MLNHGRRYVLFALGAVILLLTRAAWSKPRFLWLPAAICLSTAIAFEMILTGLADATEAARHFTFFSELLDISLLTLLVATLSQGSKNPQH